jgi:general secretion pathway protein G
MILDYQRPRRKEPVQWNLRGPIFFLLVVACLALFAVLVTPRTGSTGHAQEDAAKIDIQNLSAALETFHADNGRYPTTVEGLDALVQQPAGSNLPHWKPILDSMPIDPWGHPYIYTPPLSPHQPFKILSNGAPNGQQISN